MKILVLTSVYIGEDIPKEFTPVVHYFTREWVKMGHEVVVVYNIAFYPRIFYMVSFFFSKLISSITGIYVATKRLSDEKEYVVDGVKVFRLPMFKIFPHFKFSKMVMQNQKNRILQKLLNTQFTPDYAIGHWANPQLDLLSSLKSHLTNVKTALVMHDGGDSLIKLYKEESFELVNSIDGWGFRSEPIKNRFESIFGVKENGFMCYSGIPSEFTEQDFDKKFSDKLNSFLFVGSLIKRKYPVRIIEALTKAYDENNFQLNYIGSGNEGKQIKRIVKEKKLENAVKLHGFLTRKSVRDMMLKTDCFIMISKDEAYGLVYLEAMAAGCITIAARNEGFDGIIKHGENGFLCEAGNAIELTNLIRQINLLSIEDKQRISNNAISTAGKLTNYKAAKQYLNYLCKL